MKKGLLVLLSVVFVSAIATSCKTHENCAAYQSKAKKVKSDIPTPAKNYKQLI